MVTADGVREARLCFERQAWREAHDFWSRADRESPLGAEDLQNLAACAHMLGNDAESLALFERAHHEAVKEGDAPRAAHCAFRIGLELFSPGRRRRAAAGWRGRGASSTRLASTASSAAISRFLKALAPFGPVIPHARSSGLATRSKSRVDLATAIW